MIKMETPIKDQVRASLTVKAIKAELKSYDELGHESYLEMASKTLKAETGEGTKSSRSNWIKYKGIFYPLKMIGRMASLKGGFKENKMPGYWQNAIYNLKIKGLDIVMDADITPGSIITERKVYKEHKSIERRSKAREFIEQLGYECKACDRKLTSKDNKIWKSAFEVHHLNPLSELEVGKKRQLKIEDFVVLCSCCHKAIHRTSNVSDIMGFKKNYLQSH